MKRCGLFQCPCRRRGRRCGSSPAGRPCPRRPGGTPRTARPRREAGCGSGTGTRCGKGRCRSRRSLVAWPTSSGSSMFACSSTVTPSSVVARMLRRRFSFRRSSSNCVLAQLVFGERLAVGIDDHDALRAVDDQELVLADQLPRVVQRDDRGDVEAARDHRGVRGRPAEVGDEAREMVLLELHHVGGREIARDEDQLASAVGLRRRVAGMPERAPSSRARPPGSRRRGARAGKRPRSGRTARAARPSAPSAPTRRCTARSR